MNTVSLILISILFGLFMYLLIFNISTQKMFSVTFLKEKLKNNILHLGLILVLILLVLYLLSAKFRFFLTNQNIDPNFIIGFFTVLALFLSLIQSSKDKKYAYNLRLVESIENKGLKIIGKLLNIKQKSAVFLENLKMYQRAIDEKVTHKDSNNTVSLESINSEMESVSAYIDTYFPEEKTKWNELMDKLTLIGTNNAMVTLNYNENVALINATDFTNKTLDNLDNYIVESEGINKDIEDISFEIRQGIVEKMNNTKSRLKDSFNFKF